MNPRKSISCGLMACLLAVLLIQNAAAQPGLRIQPQRPPTYHLRFVNQYSFPVLLKLVGYQDRAIYVTTLGPGQSRAQHLIAGQRIAGLWDLQGNLLMHDIVTIDRDGMIRFGPPPSGEAPAGLQGVAAGQPGVAAGQPGVAAGQPGVAAGQPGVAAGQPGVAAGQPGVAAGQPGAAGAPPASGVDATGAAASVAPPDGATASGAAAGAAEADPAATGAAPEEQQVPATPAETGPQAPGDETQAEEAAQPQDDAEQPQAGGLTIEPDTTQPAGEPAP